MNPLTKSITILMAEDDPDDRMLIQDAVTECPFVGKLIFVEDGQELLDYLYRRDRYADPRLSPRPNIILLDLNMPRKDGRETLQEIKADPEFCAIPVVILTTSRNIDDIVRTYKMGANSYISKTVSFNSLTETLKVLGKYWCEVVELPTAY